MLNTFVGGWTLVPMEDCKLPQQVATGFGKVTENLRGATYVPVLYIGTQVVHGKNHMLICKQTMATLGAPEHLVAMVLNQNCDDGDIVGTWTLVSIEQIV